MNNQGWGIMKRRHALTDKQWEKIKSFFPQKNKMGRPPIDHRLIVDGILWVLKTGAPWRDLPSHFGPWQTVYDRFRLWSRNGMWERILSCLQSDFEKEGKIDWKLFAVDGSVVRAHKSAAGGKKVKYLESLTTTLWDDLKEASAQRSI
jgi:transposase